MVQISVNDPQTSSIERSLHPKPELKTGNTDRKPEGTPDLTNNDDTVSLSAAAKSATAATGTGESSDLSDVEAQGQAVSLRSLLSGQSLSASATQNQSILALLR